MKKIYPIIMSALCALVLPAVARAQYYSIARQATDLVSTALAGGVNYKGYVDAGYTMGVGNRQADILEFTTTQGIQYRQWFFMGAGMGVDVLFSHADEGYGPGVWSPGYAANKKYTTTSAMIPLYTSFRFTAGSPQSVSFFADVRLGAAFLVGKSYVRVGKGYISNSECFYLRPTVGVRFPVNSKNSRQAVNLGVTYQLLTNEYWYSSSSNTVLSSIGVNVGFEW